MLKKLKKTNEGFTIIEVVIVLAIAALILLIVLLAVPALQRNSRNTQRKNDVAALLAGVSEFTNNNNGQLPNGAPAWTMANGTVTISGVSAATPTTQARVGYYNVALGTANGNVSHAAAGTLTAANFLNTGTEDYVRIATGTTCSGIAGNASVAGSARSVTAVYEIETGNNTYSQQCQST
jgi:prepilin-type N-terminal cleavage/methylation domain-containing protein